MKWLYRCEELFSGLLILLVTAVLFLNVVLRFGFNSSTSWSEEFIRYGFIWITFIGGAICVRRGAHVSVDLIPNYLTEKGKKALFFATSTVTVIFLLWMCKLGMDTVSFIYQTGQTSPSLPIPMYTVYLAIPIGCLLMAIHYIEFIVKVILDKRLDAA